MITAALSLVLAAAPIKVSVEGDGYLRFVLNGRIVYSQKETLVVTHGVLASAHGPVLTPTVRVSDQSAIQIGLDGTITVDGNEAGRIVLAMFDTKPVRSGDFMVAPNRAHLVNPGDGGAGVIRVDGQGKTILSSAPKSLPTTTSKRLVIKIAESTEVSGDHVLLGDLCQLADPKLAGISLFEAPSIGVNLPLSQYRIENALKQAGIDATVEVPKNAVIYRKSQVIRREDFSAAAIKAMNEKLGVELPLSCSDLSGDYKAPAGALDLKPESFNTATSTFTVTLGIYVDGKRINSRTVTLRPDSNAVKIEANAPIKVVMRTAGLSVEVNAKARSSAYLGQTITVITDTGSVLEGRVIGPDQVEVNV